MRILYCGNFRPPHSTENHLKTTLESMGHEVIPLQEDAINKTFDILSVPNVDLFLFTRTWGQTITNDHLELLRKKGIPSASYHLDLYVGLKRDGGIEHDPFWRTDYVFTPDGADSSAKVFKEKGINHHYIKPGVFDQECYIAETPISRDIVFVGSFRNYHPEWSYRKKLVTWLQQTFGNKFQAHGSDGLGPVRGDKLNQLYASSKIAIGDSLCLNFNHPRYWSDRVYETMGRGGFIIHPYIEGMEEEFTDGKHLRFYQFNNFDHLMDVIKWYLYHDEAREKIRREGHEFVRANCTYRNRLQQMFNILGL